MKKSLTITILTFLSFHLLYAQGYSIPGRYPTQTEANKHKTATTSRGFDLSKLTIGGGIGLQFGNYTVIDISPQVGYNFSKYFNAGGGISYSYYKENYHNGRYKIKDSRSYVGMNLYAKAYPVEYIVLMMQPEASRMWRTTKGYGDKNSSEKFVPTVLVGGGLRFGPISAMLQYDVVQDDYSPYGKRLFYTIGYSWSF